MVLLRSCVHATWVGLLPHLGGSIVAGPELGIAGWSPDWDRNKVDLTDLTGLHLVPFILSPHFVPEDAALIAARLPLPYPILALRDGQAWVVDGDDQHLIDSE